VAGRAGDGMILRESGCWVDLTAEYTKYIHNSMKTAAERMREQLGKERVMTSISLRIPERVIDDMKEIAPMLGFSGYQSLMKAYISQGLRKDLEKLEGSNVAALTESLRKRGVRDEDISAAIEEAGLVADKRVAFPDKLRAAVGNRDRVAIAELIEIIPQRAWHVVPNRATADYMGLKVQVDHLSGGSGINTYDSVVVIVVWSDDSCSPLGKFDAAELQLPNYIAPENRPSQVVNA